MQQCVNKLVILIFIFVMASGGLHAQNSLSSEEGLEYLLFEDIQVITVSKKTQNVKDSPAMILVLTQKDIQLRGYSHLGEIFRDLPGMDAVKYHRSEWGTLVPVRGINGNNKIVLLINGVRVNPPGGEFAPLHSDFSIRYAKQIEIVYGPGSTLYGQDAINAVVNVITQDPADLDGQQTIGVSAGTESFKEAWFGSFSNIDLAGTPVKLSFYGSITDSELTDFEEFPEWWNLFTVDQTQDRIDKGSNLFFRLENENSSVQLWYRDSSRSSSEGRAGGRLYFTPEARWGDNALLIEVKNNNRFSDNLELESKLTYNRYEVDPDSRYVFPRGPTLFLNDYKYALGTGVNLEEKISYKHSDSFSLIGGLVLSYYDILPKATIPGKVDRDKDITSQGGTFDFSYGGNSYSLGKANALVYDTFAAYLETEWKVSEDLKLITGVRTEVHSLLDENPISPRLAVIYNASDAITLKYIYTEAFVAPAPYFTYSLFDNGREIQISNPEIGPEEAQSHEINISYENDSLRLGLSVYQNDQEQIIRPGEDKLPGNIVSTAGIASDGSARTIIQPANEGESKATGIDIYGQVSLQNFLLWSSYSFVDFESTTRNITTGLAGLPESHFRFGLTWSILNNLFFTPSLYYRSELENTTAAVLVDESDAAYELNAHILYKPTDNLDLFLNFINLTDEKNAQNGIPDPTPSETFRAKVGAQYKF